MGNLYHYLFLLLLPALSQSINLPSEIKLVTWNVLNDSDLNKEQLLCIANVHLESMMDDTIIRIKQLKSIFYHLRYCDEILLAGDFNFGEKEAEEAIFSKNYQDVWFLLKPGQRGLTFNRELNELSDDNAFWFEKSRRLDRIYFSSDCLNANHIELMGNQADKNGNMPSDHFAVLATFFHQCPL